MALKYIYVFISVAQFAFADINVLCCQQIHKRAVNNKNFIEQAFLVQSVKILLEFFFFCKFMD